MQTTKFQYIFFALLVIAVIGAVFIFSRGRGGTISLAHITIWGTLPQDQFTNFAHVATENNPNLTIDYVQKRTETFDTELVEALASQRGPDVVILPQDLLIRHQDKIYPIPYTSLSERDFKNTYIQEAELYLTPAGSLSLPLTVDPLVMYWNRDMFTNASIPVPPQYWDEFYDLSEKLTVKDSKFVITKSAAALGEYSNITHSKELLAAFFLQTGSQITKRTGEGETIPDLVKDSKGGTMGPEAAITFYTQFANPVKSFYSWNKSLNPSKDMFLAGDLATYIGFASEYPDLKAKNPNLNFDVAPIPQSRDQENKITYGNILGFAVLKVSPSIVDAFKTIIDLTSKPNIQAWSESTKLPPVRRDLLTTPPNDALGPIYYDAALQARGWLDPNPAETSKIFNKMIDDIGSNKARVYQAIGTANEQLNDLIHK